MKYIRHSLGLLLLSILIVSCHNDDDYIYPSVITEFVDAQTNSSSIFSSIRTDKGKSYSMVNAIKGNDITPDSTYRAYCKYEITDADSISATVYTMKLILSPNPISESLFKNDIITDPVTLQSIWRGGNYINMVLDVLVHGDYNHTYHFIDKGITTDANGHQILDILLYHNRQNDVEGWTDNVYLSIPLHQYAKTLVFGDFIRISINTYDGLKSYIIDY